MDNESKPSNIISIAQDFALIAKQESEIKRLREENEHLRSMLKYGTDIKTFIEPELAIIYKQVALLEDQSLIRALTTDEIKRLDLLIKNRIVLEDRQQPRDVIESEGLSQDDLTALASESNKE